jgi:hypothetical protein
MALNANALPCTDHGRWPVRIDFPIEQLAVERLYLGRVSAANFEMDDGLTHQKLLLEILWTPMRWNQPSSSLCRQFATAADGHGGSYPPAVQGLQRQMRYIPLQAPRTGPYFRTARMKYSLQLGQ